VPINGGMTLSHAGSGVLVSLLWKEKRPGQSSTVGESRMRGSLLTRQHSKELLGERWQRPKSCWLKSWARGFCRHSPGYASSAAGLGRAITRPGPAHYQEKNHRFVLVTAEFLGRNRSLASWWTWFAAWTRKERETMIMRMQSSEKKLDTVFSATTGTAATAATWPRPPGLSVRRQ